MLTTQYIKNAINATQPVATSNTNPTTTAKITSESSAPRTSTRTQISRPKEHKAEAGTKIVASHSENKPSIPLPKAVVGTTIDEAGKECPITADISQVLKGITIPMHDVKGSISNLGVYAERFHAKCEAALVKAKVDVERPDVQRVITAHVAKQIKKTHTYQQACAGVKGNASLKNGLEVLRGSGYAGDMACEVDDAAWDVANAREYAEWCAKANGDFYAKMAERGVANMRKLEEERPDAEKAAVEQKNESIAERLLGSDAVNSATRVSTSRSRIHVNEMNRRGRR